MTKQSKKSGSTKWLLVRVSGIVLLFLLLAHFWVHHFFIKDFYGQVNIVDLEMKPKTLMDYNPLWGGGEDGKIIDGVHTDLNGSKYFLTADVVKKKGSAEITIVEEPTQTEVLMGRIKPTTVESVLDRSLSRETTVRYASIQPKQIKTKRMINYDDVHARVGGSGWIWWKTYNLLFLVLALYHGLVGVWDVIADYQMGTMTRIVLYSGVNVLGLVLFILGVLIIVPM